MPKGDSTKVGEMGVSLSGGQKSRISLARAIYRKQSRIYLIDGALSSLDARVAKHILDHAIKGLLADKLVFLVTYDISLAQLLDYVLLMKDGQVETLKRTDEFFQDDSLVQPLSQ